jgi:hypothetical protein
MSNLRKPSTSSKKARTTQSLKESLDSKMADRLEGKSLNINEQLESRGGVKAVILSLNDAVREISLGPEAVASGESIKTIRELRDLLIKSHYGDKAVWALIQPLLA